MDLISKFEDGHRYFGYWSSPQGYGNQFRVKNRKEVIKYLKTYNGVENCGISVCTFKGEVPYLLYLPFDFDSNSLEDSLYDAIKLYNEIVEQGWRVHIQESGYRGYHVLIHTEPNVYSKGQIREAQTSYMDKLDLETCDTAIFGDVRRLIRIPGTCHAGKFKKVEGKWKRKGMGSYCRIVAYNDGNLMNLNKLFFDSTPDYDFDTNNSNGRKPKHPYPCVDYWLKYYRDEDGYREPPQLIRYSFVAYWLNNGLSPEEIYDKLYELHSDGKEFEWYDWEDYITMKQINHIAYNGNYNPLNCKTLKSLGFCLGPDKCPYDIRIPEFKKVKDLDEKEKILLRMR